MRRIIALTLDRVCFAAVMFANVLVWAVSFLFVLVMCAAEACGVVKVGSWQDFRRLDRPWKRWLE